MNDLLSGDPVEPMFDQNKDYLSELVGEGKKFKSPAELAKGKAEADAYIATLIKKQDADRADVLELRKKFEAQASLQDLVRQLQEKQQEAPHNTPLVDSTPKFDPADIETMISNKIEQSKMRERADANFNRVQSKLKEEFGNNFPSILQEQATMLGLSKEDVNALAMKSPEAFFRTMGLNQKQEAIQNNLPRNAQRPDFAPRTQKRTWNYYQEMKKNNPALYDNPKTIVQMHKDSAELGAAFEDGDFHSI